MDAAAAAAAEVLLVRAIEETLPGRPGEAAAAEAAAAASAAGEGGEADWLARRARHLLAGPFAEWRGLARLAEPPRFAPVLALALGFAVGALANRLGPAERIHVLINPIAALVAWNVAVYAALALAPLARRGATRVGALEGQRAQARRAAEARRRDLPHRRGVRTAVLRWTLPLLVRLRRDARDAGERAAASARVARRFGSLWLDAAPEIPANALRSVLHLGAAALAAGAIAGMLVQAVFFEYSMVWRSTFVRDPDTVAAILRAVLGPAALLLGQPLPSRADAILMQGPLGAPAARWIGLWTATALALVAVPRLLLAALAARRRRSLSRRVRLPLEDGYFGQLLAGLRRLELERIEVAIGAGVRDAIEKLAGRAADFVCERLYDARLVPRLRAFREAGGSLAALEGEMEAECRRFEPELEEHLARAQRELVTALRASVERSVGERVAARGEGLAIGAAELSRGSLATLGGSVGREVSNAAGAAVAAGVGLVVASLSGGFGHHLGVAVLVALLHTSGPVGFLIGGIGGAAVAAAGWYGGRDRLARGLRRLRLPRSVTRLALRRRALERLVAQGREACGRAVRERLGAELAPLVPGVAEEIAAQLRAKLGRLHPPAVADRTG